jgi:hypothetical protein
MRESRRDEGRGYANRIGTTGPIGNLILRPHGPCGPYVPTLPAPVTPFGVAHTSPRPNPPREPAA